MKSNFYRGIEFVCVADLPEEQQILLQSSPNYPERINILFEGEIKRNCIQYSTYSEWYESVFKTSAASMPVALRGKENGARLVLEKT
ncbi:MAG: hypothetical protein KF845_01860 [Cyclobacteriaceae bacterium]|nr:hypothetical protein [Cyclobacteriaceae bacterium]